MTGPINGHRYERRFSDPRTRFLSNERALEFDAYNRTRIADLLVSLDTQDVIAEATEATKAEADRQDRARRWESSGQVRRGDPGE